MEDGSSRCRSKRGRWMEGQVGTGARSSLNPSTQPLTERSSDTGPTGTPGPPIVEFLWNDAACHHTTDTLRADGQHVSGGCD